MSEDREFIDPAMGIQSLGRPATKQDLVEVVQSIGGEVLSTSDSYVGATRPLAYGDPRIVVREPGRYLVLRLPDEEEEE